MNLKSLISPSFISVLLLLGAGPLHAQAQLDVRNGALEWYWYADPAAAPADRFHVKCGPESGIFSVITEVLIADAPYNPRMMALKNAAQDPGLWFCVVTALSSTSESPPSNEVGFMLLPAAPSGLSALALSSSTILLTWSNNDTTAGQAINVDRKYQVSGGWLALTVFGLKNFFNNSNLKPSTVYCYRMKTIVAGIASLYSNEACARTPAG